MPVRIQGVDEDSPAQAAGIRAGMELLTIDGHEVRDGLDYEFYSAKAVLHVTVAEGEKRHSFRIAKSEYQPLGCCFSTYLIDKQHTCRNKCIFCFVDQNPKGMRSSLYFKDDDERLSFLFGNYVTLTNLSDEEVDRIIEMRISPVNISVHTANPQLRVEMMKNKNAGDVLRYIPKLAAADISINTQLVLCPGINDGEELRRSIEWLAQFQPALQSIAVVPVGITKHRDGLYPLRTYAKQEANEQLDIMLEYGDIFAGQDELRLVYPSDEWFLLAGREMPQEEFYDGYPQLENGVGMWRLMHDSYMDALHAKQEAQVHRAADLVTGVSAASLYRHLSEETTKKFPEVKLYVHPIENDFFGPQITVTGLLTGTDIVRQLKGRLRSKTLLLPETLLRAEGDLLLDDVSPQEISEKLGVKVKIVPQSGEELLEALLMDE